MTGIEIIALLTVAIIIVVAFSVAFTPSHRSMYLSEGHEPDANCKDCNGTGVMHELDDHLRMACHCTDRHLHY